MLCYRSYTVQEIEIKVVNHLYKCERWQKEDGNYIQAQLPEAIKGHHSGPTPNENDKKHLIKMFHDLYMPVANYEALNEVLSRIARWRNQIDLTPLEKMKTPCFLSSLLALS